MLALLAILVLTHAQEARVACLGDSITYGATLAERERNGYPAQLGYRLGGGFEVRNLGVGGATLSDAADRPYVAQPEFAQAVEWKPDVAVVLLGTNDTVDSAERPNWRQRATLADGARRLIAELRAGQPAVRVLLASPPPMFPDLAGLKSERAQDLRERAPRAAEVASALRQVAAALDGVEFLDLARALQAGDVSDGVHPTPFGAGAIAEHVYEAITTPTAPRLDLGSALEARGTSPAASAFHGFARLDFELDGAACTLVAPHGAARGYPWIWRARFFGHQPALDLALLDRGFHLAYCDVAGLYGAPAAVERWARFHALATDLGLHERPVLEGMSRGGLAILSFARAFPGKVSALYGDNPVFDVRSWPGGRSGKRSDADWAACLRAYDIDAEGAWSREPFDAPGLKPLAAAAVPAFLVIGTADEVVPPAENADAFARAYLDAGGRVETWSKPGAGHHPHGLHPPAPLVRALRRALGFGRNPATFALPSAEYRGGPAGWGGGTWWAQVERMRELALNRPDLELVFLGDSITQGLTGATKRYSIRNGARPFDRFHGRHAAISLGLSGDRTEHLLWRIEHGALQILNPRVIVLQIGVNNVGARHHTGFETGEGVVAVVRALREHEPQARVLIVGPFPTGATPDDPRRLAIDRVHSIVAPLDDVEHVRYLDLRGFFLDAEGRPNERMRPDHVHISEAGQTAWLQALERPIARLLAD